jgi:tetratricopeptide (TPR) repeat protein
LDACHYPEALGAFRSSLIVDPANPVAHVGIAECTIAMGQYELAIERLVNSAHRLAESNNRHAHTLIKRAMILAPNRLELHVDAAQIELALGQIGKATERLWRLAAAYRGEGRRDDAIEIEQLVESLQADAGVVEPAQTGMTAPLSIEPGAPMTVARAHTDAVSRPVLLFPDGTPMPAAVAAVVPTRGGWGKTPRKRPPAGSVRFRVQPPPKLRRPIPRS